MEIQRAFQIATREWANIKLSLSMCGDIGGFNFRDFVSNGSERLSFLRNTIEMENKFPAYRYFTPEAAYVFATLALKAGERIGLTDRIAQIFGIGYGWIRTGCLNPYRGTEGKGLLRQMVFFKLFFPLGVDLLWDFNSPMVKVKLKNVFDKLVAW